MFFVGSTPVPEPRNQNQNPTEPARNLPETTPDLQGTEEPVLSNLLRHRNLEATA